MKKKNNNHNNVQSDPLDPNRRRVFFIHRKGKIGNIIFVNQRVVQVSHTLPTTIMHASLKFVEDWVTKEKGNAYELY